MYDEKIKKYLYSEEYDLLIQEVDREIEENSFEASFYYYRFLAKNKDYSHMDFNNLIDKDDYNRAMELDFMHTFDTEFKFFKILNNEERKLFQYALHMNIAKFNEAIKSFNVSNSNTFLNRDEARLLSEYANTLTENTQKELTGKLLLFYTQDREWDPTLRSVKNMVEDVVLLFESSSFKKIEKEPISTTEAIINLNEDKEENDTAKEAKREPISITEAIINMPKEGAPESSTNKTIIPPKENSTVGNSKRIYSNGSTYLSSSNVEEYTPKRVKEIDNRVNLERKNKEKRLFIKTFVGILIFILAIIIGVVIVVSNTKNTFSSQNETKEELKISSNGGFGLAGGTAIITLRCPKTYNGKSIERVDGIVYLEFKNSESGGSAYCSVTPTPSNFNISMDSKISLEDMMNGYSLTFTVHYICYSDGTIDTYPDLITIHSMY